MQVFRFFNKQQTKTYMVFTIISIVLSIFIFSNLDSHYINIHLAYLFVVILSFISIMYSIKQASRSFEEIIIEEKSIKFYFFNKMKKPISTFIDELDIQQDNNKITIKNKESKELIGEAFKNRLENIEKWDELINLLQDRL